jgi:hypothetical protein
MMRGCLVVSVCVGSCKRVPPSLVIFVCFSFGTVVLSMERDEMVLTGRGSSI